MKQIMFFVYGCIITCLVGNAIFLYHHLIVDNGTIPLSHVRYRIIFEHSTGIHPTYMSIYLCLAVCITLLSQASSRTQIFIKYLLQYALLLFMLALFAKAPLIALALIAVHYLYEHRSQLYKFKWGFVALAATVTGAYFFIPFSLFVFRSFNLSPSRIVIIFICRGCCVE